ncbi:hypothetical protein KI387_026282, partial [Taxus chinensis]
FDALLAHFDWLHVTHSNVSENDIAQNGVEEGTKVCVQNNEVWVNDIRKACVITCRGNGKLVSRECMVKVQLLQ